MQTISKQNPSESKAISNQEPGGGGRPNQTSFVSHFLESNPKLFMVLLQRCPYYRCIIITIIIMVTFIIIYNHHTYYNILIINSNNTNDIN